jgi:hypothetical protein
LGLGVLLLMAWSASPRGAALAGAAAPSVGAPSVALPLQATAGEAPPSSAAASEPAAPPATPQAEERADSGGDAEPAPSLPGAPRSGGGASSDSGDVTGRHRVAISARFAYRLGDAGRAVTPAAGYGIAGTYDFAYARPDDVIELAVGVDFSSDRFATGEQGVSTQVGVAATFSSTRVISENNFVLTHTVAFRVAPVRPFFALGAGVGVGYFDSVATAYRPGYERDTHFLGRASLGLDLRVTEVWSITLRGDYTFVRGASAFMTEGGLALPLFGDVLDINLGAAYRF